MPTSTTNLELSKPIPNSATDADQWGDILNDNFDSLDSLIPITTAAKTASFSVGVDEFNYCYLINSSGGAVVAGLPAAADVFNGFMVTFKAVDASNAITIDGNLSETIDGSSSVTLDNDGDVIKLVCDGSNWQQLVRVPSAAETINYASNSVSNAGSGTEASLTPANFGTQRAASNNGYQRLPGGLLLQWGRYTNATTSQTHSFPTAFSSVFVTVVSVVGDPYAGAESVTLTSPPTTTSFTAGTYSNSSFTAGISFHMYAIGT